MSNIPLRDYLAGQALAGYLAAHSGDLGARTPMRHTAAEWAYKMADSMIEESKKKEESK